MRVRLSRKCQRLFPGTDFTVSGYVKEPEKQFHWFIENYIKPKTSLEDKFIFIEPFEYRGDTIFIGITNNKPDYLLDIVLLEET